MTGSDPFGGNNLVRFDGIRGTTFIDRKLSFYSSRKGLKSLLRQSAAIEQNPGFSLLIEVPTPEEMKRIVKYLSRLNIENIDVMVVPQ